MGKGREKRRRRAKKRPPKLRPEVQVQRESPRPPTPKCLSTGGHAELMVGGPGRELSLSDPDFNGQDCFNDRWSRSIRRVDRDPVAFSPSGRHVFYQRGEGPACETKIIDLFSPYERAPAIAPPCRPAEMIPLQDWLARKGCDLFSHAGFEPPTRPFALGVPIDVARHLDSAGRRLLLTRVLDSGPSVDAYRQVVRLMALLPEDETATVEHACEAVAGWPDEARRAPPRILDEATPEPVWRVLLGASPRVCLVHQRLEGHTTAQLSRRPEWREVTKLSLAHCFFDTQTVYTLFDVGPLPLRELILDRTICGLWRLGQLFGAPTLTSLRRLSVVNASISRGATEARCEGFALTALEELDLSGDMFFDDQDLETVARWGTFGRLRRLRLVGTVVSRERVAALRDQYPQLAIVRDAEGAPPGTGSGGAG